MMRKILFIYTNNFRLQDIVWGFIELQYDIEIYEHAFHSYNHYAEASEQLRLHLEQNDYWFVMSYNFSPDISDICTEKKLPYVSWTIDSLELPIHSEHCMRPYNFIHIFDYEEYCLVKNRFAPPHVYYLPLAANTTRLGSRQLTPEDIERFSSAVSFVGNLYTGDELKLLEEKQLLPPPIQAFFQEVVDYYTGRWNGESIYDCLDPDTCRVLNQILPEGYRNHYAIDDAYYYAFTLLGLRTANHDRMLLLKTLSERFPLHFWGPAATVDFPLIQKGSVNYESEFSKVAALSKINVNLTIPRIATGINLRCFDIMGSGGFLMTNYRHCMQMHFQENEDFVSFTDPDDLLRKTEYYLTHEKERLQITLNGYEKVLAKHTCVHRAQELIAHVTDAGYPNT